MASSHAFVFLLAIATFSPEITCAVEFIVGDNAGWTLGYDYKAWAAGKDFRVGDKLVFQYPVGAHNVFKVNGTAFQNCTKPPPSQALTSGNDTIVLATPGTKWYICGVGMHCASGQKLAVTVKPQAQPPSMEPPPSPYHAARSASKVNKRPHFNG